MYHLATVFPFIKRLRIPFSRDQLMLLMVAANLIIIAVDVFLAHSISGTIVPYEWIPIIFGLAAGGVLLFAGLVALRRRTQATMLASLVFFASILVGVLGSYFHLVRAIRPSAPFGQQVSLDLFVWAPPILGPLSFVGIALWGLSAAWAEDPVDSGTLALPRGRKLHLPTSKTRGYLLLVSLGILASLISSALDHARTGFENPWLWLPIAAGVFATLAAFLLAAVETPGRNDLLAYVGAMLLLILVGMLGAYFHIQADLTADNIFIVERFLRGAPFLAPLQFSNLGMLGLMALLDPKESG